MKSDPTNSKDETVTLQSSETEPPANIDDLRKEIDELDAAILAAVKRRTEVSELSPTTSASPRARAPCR